MLLDYAVNHDTQRPTTLLYPCPFPSQGCLESYLWSKHKTL